MVKKVEGGRQIVTTKRVEAQEKIQSVGVKGISEVTAAQSQTPTRSVRRATRPMTAEEREHLFKLIQEEADKMFGQDIIPPKKRQQVESAVMMTIDASMVNEETDGEESDTLPSKLADLLKPK